MLTTSTSLSRWALKWTSSTWTGWRYCAVRRARSFGRGSIGGVIRMISKQPEGTDTGYAELTTGSYQAR